MDEHQRQRIAAIRLSIAAALEQAERLSAEGRYVEASGWAMGALVNASESLAGMLQYEDYMQRYRNSPARILATITGDEKATSVNVAV